jgi:hypothetical protein
MFDSSRRRFLAGAAAAVASASAGCGALSGGGGDGPPSGWADDWAVPSPDSDGLQSLSLTDHAAVRALHDVLDVDTVARYGTATEFVGTNAPETSLKRFSLSLTTGEFDADRIGRTLRAVPGDGEEGAYERVDDGGEFVRYRRGSEAEFVVDAELFGWGSVSSDGSTPPEFDAALASVRGDGETLYGTDDTYAALVDRLDEPTFGVAERFGPSDGRQSPGVIGTVELGRGAVGYGGSIVLGRETTTHQQVQAFPDAGVAERGHEELADRARTTYEQDGRFLVARREGPLEEIPGVRARDEDDDLSLFALDYDDGGVRATYVAGPELPGDVVAVGPEPVPTDSPVYPFEGGRVQPGDTTATDAVDADPGTALEVELDVDDRRQTRSWGLVVPEPE